MDQSTCIKAQGLYFSLYAVPTQQSLLMVDTLTLYGRHFVLFKSRPYRAVNTFCFRYKKQSVNILALELDI